MSIPFNFRLTDFPSEAETLRLEVREFLSTALVDVPKETRAETWYGADEGFSRKVGERGWIGDNPFIYLDTQNINQMGWKPKLGIQEAILKTIKFLRLNEWVFEERK